MQRGDACTWSEAKMMATGGLPSQVVAWLTHAFVPTNAVSVKLTNSAHTMHPVKRICTQPRPFAGLAPAAERAHAATRPRRHVQEHRTCAGRAYMHQRRMEAIHSNAAG